MQEILDAWNSTVAYIVSGHHTEFLGRKKEALIFQYMKQRLANAAPQLRVNLEVPYNNWQIDLVGRFRGERVAVEGKFKLQTDAAVPDNRKAAFFDLYKLEQYVDSSSYSSGLFVWLTNKAEYIQKATGDSKDFSTHDGRIYLPQTPLNAKRCRDKIPLPLVLTRRYDFTWNQIASSCWYTLSLVVRPTSPREFNAASTSSVQR
ncbi:MAG: hypothetical protein WB341_14865 [Terracidiphilus sp.]